MRFLHLADLHFGKSIYGTSLLENGDQSAWVDRFLTLAESVRPDAVVIAGDVYDRGAPSGDAVQLLSRMLTGLSALSIPVMMCAGNHDSVQRLSFLSPLLAREGLHISGSLYENPTLSHVTLGDEHGPVTFWLMPYVFPALIAGALGDESLRDSDSAVRALLNAQPIDWTKRNVLIAHQNVTANGTPSERGGSESMVGGVGQIDYTVFDGFDYVALGHIHAAYPVGREAVRYAGSPLCYHFNETRQAAKGPLLVELGAKGSPVTVTLLPIEPLHRLRVLEGAYDALRAELSGALPSPEGQYLSITLTDRRVTPELAEDLRARCEARGSLLMELRSVWQEARSEAALRVSALREQGLAELFAAFCAQRSGTEPDEAELALLRSAEALAEQADHRLEPEPEQIDRLLAEALRKTKS